MLMSMVSSITCKNMQPQDAFVFSIFLLFSIANSQTPRTERAILLGIKKQWGNGAYLHQWNSTSSLCEWPFISCTKGSVTEIWLPGMGIRGSFLVTLLCQLKNLSSINFSTNSISGTIPPGITRCSKLEKMCMPTNLLTGTIPGELFSMKRLRRLDLRQNMLFGGIPTPLLAYSLETLDLSSNRLNGSIPEEISNLYGLVYLDLSSNSFSGPIPAAFSHLYSLSKLSLAFNHLNGSIPVEFGQLLQLKDMDVSHNQLSGDIWGSFYTLRSELALSICSNNLSGRIPDDLVFNRFPKSCFDPENLCSSVPTTSGLPRCVSDSCSDHAFQGQKSCKSVPSKRKKIIIITCGAIAGALIGLVILLAVFRHGMERRTVNDRDDDVSMISYQRLKFNKWEVLAGLIDENLVGNGGSAKVYKVITRRGQSLAVKSIRHEVTHGHMLEKQFLAEVKILGEIRHNIVKLLCCITGNTTKVLVYEYLEKECIHKWLHGKKNHSMSVESSTQWERRLKIAIGASQGLCHMHHHCHPPIVHRDIKSSNILVDSEFNAKIADFGLAKMLASQGDPETASAVVGTFGYIAPEYGSTRKVNVKSDVYSFGVVLLELTTGREAVTRYEEVNLAQWAHRHQREGNPVVDALDEEIKCPHHLKEATNVFNLGLVCTSILPSRRPSMKDVVHILQRCRCNENDQSLPGEPM